MKRTTALKTNRTLLALAVLAAAAGSVQAQSSPYYVGIAQALAYDSNVNRWASDVALPAGTSRSDTVSTTSLLAGFDQTSGRQRYYVSTNLRAVRYSRNDGLNHEGHAIDAGWDWSTIERLSGTVSAGSRRSLASTATGNSTQPTLQTLNYATLLARVGVVTRLTAEASLTWRDAQYSASQFSSSEFSQTALSAGLRYRLGGSTTIGAGLRTSDIRYNRPGDTRRRNDLDLLADWKPGGNTEARARLSFGRQRPALSTVPAFSGVTGDLQASWQATGKIRVTGRFTRDSGQDTSFLNFVNSTITLRDERRTANIVFLGADYALSSKIGVNAGLTYSMYDVTTLTNPGAAVAVYGSGRENNTALQIGATWTPIRTLLLGCGLTYERREITNRAISAPIDAQGVSCFGQFVLR